MTLMVWTARVSYGGPDRLDVTRKSAGPDGLPFAPSWAILGPALEARAKADGLRGLADIETHNGRHGDATALRFDAHDIEARAWAAYVPAYRAEMLTSYRVHRAAWEALLDRRRVALCCYCADPARCHRTLLAGYLDALGAKNCGELEVPERELLQVRLPGVPS